MDDTEPKEKEGNKFFLDRAKRIFRRKRSQYERSSRSCEEFASRLQGDNFRNLRLYGNKVRKYIRNYEGLEKDFQKKGNSDNTRDK